MHPPRTAPHRVQLTRIWTQARRSPFLPAVVLVLIVATAAALFAGAYSTYLAAPRPHKIPIAVTEQRSPLPSALSNALDTALDGSLDLRRYPDDAHAYEALQEQHVLAVLQPRTNGSVGLDVAGAAGTSVADLLTRTAPEAARQAGIHLTVTDVLPPQPSDPRGLALFYMTLAAVIIGFIGALQLNVHAARLRPGERIAFNALTALIGGFAITATIALLIGTVDLPLWQSWAVLTLTMFASAMGFTMFTALFGRWAMVPTWGIVVLVGNIASGGLVPGALLPPLLARTGQLLPPGASISAHRTAIYFPDHQHATPYLVLAGWSLVSCAVFWVRRQRYPGGR